MLRLPYCVHASYEVLPVSYMSSLTCIGLGRARISVWINTLTHVWERDSGRNDVETGSTVSGVYRLGGTFTCITLEPSQQLWEMESGSQGTDVPTAALPVHVRLRGKART